jgi:hypothetical protein
MKASAKRRSCQFLDEERRVRNHNKLRVFPAAGISRQAEAVGPDADFPNASSISEFSMALS